MFRHNNGFAGFSVDDISAAKQFYEDTLGLEVTEQNDTLTIQLGGGAHVFIYAKGPAHEPASFTVLNFPVDDIDAAVVALKAKGVVFVEYETELVKTDADGIARGNPNIAWFTDPAGNIISVLSGEM